ncbi:hypothetical protein ACK302_16555, partial [Aeromonas caviae]
TGFLPSLLARVMCGQKTSILRTQHRERSCRWQMADGSWCLWLQTDPGVHRCGSIFEYIGPVSFDAILKRKAKYVLGLNATPIPSNGL